MDCHAVLYTLSPSHVSKNVNQMGQFCRGSPLSALLVGSIICFTVAADFFDSENSKYAWAVSAGVVSTVVCLVLIVLHFMNKDPVLQYGIFPAGFLVVWWVCGVAFTTTTTNSPFSSLGNGYFGVWIAFAASVYYFFLIGAFQFKMISSFINGLAVCLSASVIEFSIAAKLCDDEEFCENRRAWAVAVGVLSCVVCLLGMLLHKLRRVDMEQQYGMVVGGALTILWAFGAGFNTSSEGPFVAPGNGYFATWIAFFSSLYYFVNMTPFVREAITKALKDEATANKQWNADGNNGQQLGGASTPKEIEAVSGPIDRSKSNSNRETTGDQ
eukprot:CFRG0903T1